MRLLSVNVSEPKEVPHKGKVVRTGIFKEPVEGRVAARMLNLEGDGQADLLAHGGEMRAVLVYSLEDYAGPVSSVATISVPASSARTSRSKGCRAPRYRLATGFGSEALCSRSASRVSLATSSR